MFQFQHLEVYNKSKLFHIQCKQIIGAIKIERYVRDQLGRASLRIMLKQGA